MYVYGFGNTGGPYGLILQDSLRFSNGKGDSALQCYNFTGVELVYSR